MTKTLQRCEWSVNDPIMQKYHDKEWGVPMHSDRKLFEFLTLEGAQAGLSWLIVLKKREGYRKAFDNFDAKKIARYGPQKAKKLLNNPNIIRNRLKIKSTIQNAKAFLAVKKEFGSFNKYIWHYIGNRPIKNKWKRLKQIPAKTPVSDLISKDLKERGFKFVGSTIIYAHMQATGMVNDHITTCFRYKQV